MIAVRGGRGSHIAGPSTHNKRIGYGGMCTGGFAMKYFTHLKKPMNWMLTMKLIYLHYIVFVCL